MLAGMKVSISRGTLVMWLCLKCGERIEDQFEVCWNCGTSPTGVQYPTFRRVDKGDGTRVRIKLRCPNPDCGKALSVSNQRAGKGGNCPACGTAVSIPQPQPERVVYQSQEAAWVSAAIIMILVIVVAVLIDMSVETTEERVERYSHEFIVPGI